MRYTIFSNSHCPLLNITHIGYSADAELTHFGPGVRNSYIIHYIISGKGCFNGECVSGGQGFLITPGMNEYYYPDPNEPWEYLWVVSEDPKMADLFACFHADSTTHIFRYDYVNAVKELSSFLIANNKVIYHAFEMLEIFIKIFKHQHQITLSHTIKSNAEVYVDAAEKYIASNIHRPVTVSELTEFLGVSQPYLFRIFQEKFSRSPKQFMTEQKLLRAKNF